LLPLFPEAHYTLVDASEQMIHICEARFKEYHVEYVTSYFKDFEFKDDCYEMITAGFSLHHCDSEEKKQLFKNIYRSLKKGGIVSYSDLMIDKNKPEHLKLLKDWKAFVHKSFPDGEKWEWLMEHYNEFDKPDDFQKQSQWLEEAGFTTIEVIAKEGYWMHLRGIRD
jgi:ubiquinone/menaquinone biosynthesis C-methylase UbiE